MTTTLKKSKAPLSDFADARKACRTPAEHEQLAIVIKSGWTSAELSEYARLLFFRNGRDYPTPASYRGAIADIERTAVHKPHGHKPSYNDPFAWRRLFRKGSSKLVPPRREGLLQRGRGNTGCVSSDEYAWPGHTEEYRSMIEQRCRDYFKIGPSVTVHVNAWAASQRAYHRELEAAAAVVSKQTEAVNFILAPKKSPKGSPRRKLAPQYDEGGWWGPTLKPHFNYEFPGHTPAFREEVAARARKDREKKPDAHISPRSWKIACHKHYVLIERGKV
jgi:hypothetical protein